VLPSVSARPLKSAGGRKVSTQLGTVTARLNGHVQHSVPGARVEMNTEVAGPSPFPEPEPKKTHPVWMEAILLSPLALKRTLYLLSVPPAILGVSMHLGHGVPGLALMVLAAWPFPFRLRTSSEGVHISWLFLKERILWKDIRSVGLAIDNRKLFLGKRKPVLVLERHGARPVTLRAPTHVLSQIDREILRRRGSTLPGGLGA
jgi:hypothetical protein